MNSPQSDADLIFKEEDDEAISDDGPGPARLLDESPRSRDRVRLIDVDDVGTGATTVSTDRGERTHRSAAFLTGSAALVAAVLTVAVIAVPFLRFAYRAPALHVMLETVNAIVALLVGYLIYGRYKQSPRLQTLLLVLALSTVAVANLVLTAIPSALGGGSGGLSSWAPLTVRLIGTLLLFAAALTPTRAHVDRRRAVVLVSCLAGLGAVVAAAGVTWGGLLPTAVDPSVLGDGSRPVLVAHPAVLAVQALGAVLYGVAAVAFTRQARRTGDELFRWVAAGCVLASFARVHYLFFPSLYTDYVYTGDLLRLGGYLVMLVGAARELRSYWELKAQAAVVEDRRRMARDLHDGLTQELSYIWSQSHRLATHPEDTALVERIRGSADRAIDESRRAIAALTRPAEGSLSTALQHAGEELTARYDAKVLVVADPGADADAALSEALLRITGEAVRNAVRHGSASRIDVVLTADPLSLTVRDDGCGFAAGAPGALRPGGFGMTSMRERAEAVGATLDIESAPGDGTTVKVSWL